MAQNPVFANDLVVPIDGTAAAPSISIGGDGGRGSGNSGSGFYGTYGTLNLSISGTKSMVFDSSGLTLTSGYTVQSDGSSYSGASSYQPLGPDLNLAAGAGKNIGTGTAFLASVMGNVIGASLTKTGNYLGGVIGMYSVSGVKGTTQPAGGLLAGIADGVTDADGAVVAFIDGDGSQTNAGAAFKAMSNNSTAGSGFNYGLDLYGAAHDGYSALAILKADIRLASQAVLMTNAGAPTSGTTGANFAGKGSLLIDVTNGKLYINTNTLASPTWTVVGTQS